MKNDSLCEQAYNYIFQKIMTFEYRPNDPIIENNLVRELGLSRTPLREALRRLEADGLVYKVKNRGTYVRTFSYEDITESCEIRSLFELYALKLCIERVPKEKLEQLRMKFQSLDENSPRDDYNEADVALHKTIMTYCLNSKMVLILDSLNAQLEIFRHVSAQTPNRLKKSRQEHLNILDAIEKRDLQEASAVLCEHMENVKNSTIQAFQSFKMNQI